MSVFKVGRATITRIEETCQPIYTPEELFPEWTDAHLAEHSHWLAPNHYDPETRKLKLSVHSWLLQFDGRKILIDACCGNQKSRPLRPWWNNLNTPWLERLAAAGARPDEIDMVMCTHLHRDHLGWNTQLQNGRWEPTFRNARYVFSKPDFDYFQELDRDLKTVPAEFGTFRESVLPIVEAAPRRSGQRAASA
jgi:glyoxylase-like metal-dependent hydrolase (beta-lactamase superfamily II)